MRRIFVLIFIATLAGPAMAQTDPRVCDTKQGYIDVYLEFLMDYTAAKENGTLVDPEATNIAVWMVQYENRMMQGVPVGQLCREMIELRAKSSFAERKPCIFCD